MVLISFQYILDNSAVLLVFQNFFKLWKGYLFLLGNQFSKMAELLGAPFYISILKI